MLKNTIIGNKISGARKRVNISQAQLAERLFISPQAVGKWERGESMPDIITFNRLAEIFGVDLNYFSEGFQSAAAEATSVQSMIKQPAETPAGEANKKLKWDMSHESWVDGDFSGLKNLQERFSSSNMENCKFAGSDMSGLILKGNNVLSCDFSGSAINNSHIQNSNLANNFFNDCSLKDSEFTGSCIKDCNFSSADLTGAEIKSSDFLKNTVTNVLWIRSSFKGTQITNIVFEGKLEDCFFENCTFTGVKFQNATLSNTFFKNNRKLKRVKFIDCKVDKMTYAFLKNGEADLSGITIFIT